MKGFFTGKYSSLSIRYETCLEYVEYARFAERVGVNCFGTMKTFA